MLGKANVSFITLNFDFRAFVTRYRLCLIGAKGTIFQRGIAQIKLGDFSMFRGYIFLLFLVLFLHGIKRLEI